MTDHKYTDDEVIRALECCAVDPNSGKFSDCKNCPLDDKRTAYCFEFEIQKLALDLINRQRAEIDDLKRDTVPKLQWSLQRANEMGRDLEVELKAMRGAANSYKIHYENAKAEAVKEFAERLKERHYFHASCIGNCYQMYGNDIDTLVKEMTGEKGCPTCKHFIGCETACGGEPCDLFK